MGHGTNLVQPVWVSANWVNWRISSILRNIKDRYQPNQCTLFLFSFSFTTQWVLPYECLKRLMRWRLKTSVRWRFPEDWEHASKSRGNLLTGNLFTLDNLLRISLAHACQNWKPDEAQFQRIDSTYRKFLQMLIWKRMRVMIADRPLTINDKLYQTWSPRIVTGNLISPLASYCTCVVKKDFNIDICWTTILSQALQKIEILHTTAALLNLAPRKKNRLIPWCRVVVNHSFQSQIETGIV